MREPSSGRLYQAVALGHVAVGAAIHRRGLGEIRRAGAIGAVPLRGERATAFWFLAPAPLLWGLGAGMRRAEARGDIEAVRAGCRLGAAAGAAGAICMPVSGFWALLAVSLRGLWRARRR